ncbi:MAG: GspE/PulE family protein [Patescibacteria group bacterium]
MARNVLDILIAQKELDDREAAEIRKESKKKSISVEEELLLRGLSDEAILKAKGEALGVPVMVVRNKKADFELLKHMPEESARHYQIAPLGMDNGVMQIGMVDPESTEAKEALKFIASRLNMPFKIYLISKKDFDGLLEGYKGISGEVSKALGELESALGAEGLALPKVPQKEGVAFVEEAPIIKIVAVILKHATEGRASDIHIEPERDKLRVRFRVDGVLHTSLSLPAHVHEPILSRIKILTNMQLDEKRKPQDGRFSARIENREIDFRVSTFPTYFGEKAVLRILDSEAGIKKFEDLGLDGKNLEIVKEGLEKPYGLILITGPTGSGKSTTLYAMLDYLNKEKWNIVSLEDPIEYSIEGVNQSQVRPEIGYDFAEGIRHILRQDPDIIMVGEIRDKETAKLAIHAALTGHLVFSTLHTNNAIGVIPRLIDMGVDPYLIAPTLNLAIAQRLVRKLCDESRDEVAIEGSVKDAIMEEVREMPETVQKSLKIPPKVYRAKPSAICPSGPKGRLALFEILSMTKSLEKLILSKPSETDVEEEAKKQGMVTLKQNGIMRVLEGKIGLEELFEVT